MRTRQLPDVFVADDKFDDVVRCLEARGWRRHAHAAFPKFRLKWTNYSRIAWPDAARRVQPEQWLNHFHHAVRFSQKDVFARALYAHELACAPGAVSVDAFFPRTFDLRRADDVQSLREWHLYSRALAVLKCFAAQPAAYSSSNNNSSSTDVRAELDAACALLQSVVAAGAAFFSRAQAHAPVFDVDAPAWQPLRRRPSTAYQSFEGSEQSTTDSTARLALGHEGDDDERERERVMTRILAHLQVLDAQFDTVVAAHQSVWICKPSNLSQGRGICLLTSLDDILSLTQQQSPHAPAAANDGDAASVSAGTGADKWIVQKYIEQPLLQFQHGRKFDIRQWVLLTSLAPLRVFWYHACYLRFCAQPFGAAQLSDVFAHLSNHSVQKHAPVATHSSAGSASIDQQPSAWPSAGSDDASAFESMWSSEQFQRHLWQEHGRDVWTETIVPQMQRATYTAICSTAPQLESVGRGFEWLGLDFVLDEQLRPWLLEVNVSPDVSHSTHVTAELVPRATADLLELLLDDVVSADNGWLPLEGVTLATLPPQQL